MWQRNFDVGIADVWDYAVFHFLFFSNVKHIVATSAQPIQSVYYDFMHFSVEMKHNPGKSPCPLFRVPIITQF
jgi:hypothetical protein